jgi:hypothetical protein
MVILLSSGVIEIRKGMSETVPWTFQIVDVVFVSRTSTYSLYILSGYLCFVSHFTGTLLKLHLNIALMCCIAELYVVYIDMIFCPTDCVTLLFHVFCQYTSFKIVCFVNHASSKCYC